MNKKLKALRQRRGEIADEMQALIDGGLDDESRASFDELQAEAEKVKADILRLEALLDEQRDQTQIVTPPALPEVTPRVTVEEEPRDRGFPNLAENLRAIINASRPGGRIDERLSQAPPPDQNAQAIGQFGEQRATGLSEKVPSDGGFFLHTEQAGDMLDATFQTGLLVPRVAQYTIADPAASSVSFNVLDETSRAAGSRLGGIRLYTRDEAETVTASKAKWRKIEYKPVSVMGLCYLTEEQMQDTPAVAQLVDSYFRNEAGFDLDDWIIRGDGASQPEGFLNASCILSNAKETGQVADTIVVENIHKMYARIPARIRNDAVWITNQTCEPELFGLTISVGTGGVPVYMAGGNIAGAPFGTILGRAVLPMEQAASLGDANDLMFVAPSQYLLVRKGGMQSAISVHVNFIYGEVVLRFMFRVTGKTWWKSAITPYKGADDLGPFVGLAERA